MKSKNCKVIRVNAEADKAIREYADDTGKSVAEAANAMVLGFDPLRPRCFSNRAMVDIPLELDKQIRELAKRFGFTYLQAVEKSVSHFDTIIDPETAEIVSRYASRKGVSNSKALTELVLQGQRRETWGDT